MIMFLARLLTFWLPNKELRKKYRFKIITLFYGRQVLRKAKSIGKDFYCGGYSTCTSNTILGEHVCFNGMTIQGKGTVKIGRYFHSNYSALRFIVKQRLCLPTESHRTGKRRISFDKDDSPMYVIGISVLCVLISIVFITMPNRYKSITREEAQQYEGAYSSHNQDGQDYVDIIFEDETELTIHQCCAYGEILDGLKSLHKGEKLYVLINPTTDYIVELKTESKEILNFDDSQRLMLFEAKAFMWLGIVLDAISVILTAYGIYQLTKERKEDK